MSRAFDQAVKNLRTRREALQGTVNDLRGRLSPPQLAEDALNLLDPELTLLGRIKERIENNRLLSLAVLAGVGWLVGAPRQHDSQALGARQASTTPPRANMKEKKNDSGPIHGKPWSGPAGGRTQERTQEAVLARRNRKAEPERGSAPAGGEPQQHPAGEQRQVAQQQPREEQPQQQPEVPERQF
jgi:hypothetical protein